MNHSVFGRKLSRSKNERQRLFYNLVRDMVIHGKIVTSQAKAKAVQPLIEQLITRAKKGQASDRRLIMKTIIDGKIADMLMAQAKDRFAKRTSGYTRIVKLGVLRKDASKQAMLSFVDEPIAVVEAPKTVKEAAPAKPAEAPVKSKTEKKPAKKPAKK